MPRLILIIATVSAFAPVNTLDAEILVMEGWFSQPIPASDDGHQWMDPVSLNIDHHFIIEDLNVTLSITHSDVSDLYITLESPTGQTVTLKDTWPLLWRKSRPNMTDVTFDDTATGHAIDSLPPYTGIFLPEPGNVLADFNSFDAFGQWTLKIYDGYYANTGTLDHLRLTFTTSHTPEPASLTTFSILTLLAFRRQKNACRAGRARRLYQPRW